MAQIYISVGSNIERERYIQAGIDAMAALFGPLTLSSVFESEAVGFNGTAFYNLVVGAQTELSPQQVALHLKAIEVDNGRKPNSRKFSPRTLDLDLLLYDDLITDDGVQLPRDEIPHNAFVLWPLAELAPELIHPVLGQSYASLWQAYDKSSQSLCKIPFIWNTSLRNN
ncbi:2-amino-4-hydroxy-6-hydroxymethyldihydropteridine diphosphokinase [Motilimonas sp. 1_MG-2023]|uniref:2-amino-4-hydroxy-6- hydroxymethyldihydropteridine diphosphokinase n=1 Tax=Motilimonas sp. 1_MG-2023 TaxID=3062672 RepID=UPI0026E2D1E2|nr:2-amino-4-hydroxy-6-hydroxymethyldihydropteridine diphosphokinase [Motilimonas sp. 1_MG-2023]MDO6526871.1 2-amino-4-hydroxy-6-hydroxymethyldihydropteridine diphosphokinase [Motilimonas sp. 1_MG-2023]